MHKTDTICAIASAMTNAGIGIIRVSGEDAIAKVDQIYKGKHKLTEVESHTVQYGHIIFEDQIVVLIRQKIPLRLIVMVEHL